MGSVTTDVKLDQGSLTALEGSLRGQLIRPDDPRYEEHRRVWNGSIDRHPALIARCAGVADVIVENFSSGVMRRLQLDYESLEPSNPGLIYVSMSGFGHTGPRQDWTRHVSA